MAIGATMVVGGNTTTMGMSITINRGVNRATAAAVNLKRPPPSPNHRVLTAEH
jgi:hypothetical protein